jgi:hypothetical protein
MRFVAFASDGKPALGLRMGDDVVDLTAEGLPATLSTLLAQGAGALASAQSVAKRAKTRRSLAGLAHLPSRTPGRKRPCRQNSCPASIAAFAAGNRALSRR